ASLFINPPSVAFNGWRYRAVVTNSAGTATSTSARFTVYGAASVNPKTAQFHATKAGAAGTLGAVTGPQDIAISFTGAASSWFVSSDQPWLVVSPGSGPGNGHFTLSIANPDNVIGASTSLTATITLTDPLVAPNFVMT